MTIGGFLRFIFAVTLIRVQNGFSIVELALSHHPHQNLFRSNSRKAIFFLKSLNKNTYDCCHFFVILILFSVIPH